MDFLEDSIDLTLKGVWNSKKAILNKSDLSKLR